MNSDDKFVENGKGLDFKDQVDDITDIAEDKLNKDIRYFVIYPEGK